MNGPQLQLDPNFKASAGTARVRGGYTGRVMGGFCLHDELASGGMASVYLAYKEGPRGIGQMAAIKVMHPHLSHRREYVDMFLDEARISSCISHPNVVRVLDFGEDDGSYYLAMEHLTGKTWYDVWCAAINRKERRELSLLPRLAAWVLSQACEGLHIAHEALDLSGSPLNVVHRDISPQNVFVTFDGNVRVIDFGIASAEKRLHITSEGMIKGRIAYMSPEQMTGAPTDRRADVWSMGVLLWEALARQRLFARFDDSATIAAVVTAHVPPIPESVGEVPEELLAIALKALQRNPDDRFATARQMADALSCFVLKSGRLTAADVSAHMQPMFADDIAQQQQQRADAADAFALFTTREVLPTVKPVRPLPWLDATEPEGKLNPSLHPLEPSLSELLPTLVTAGTEESARTAETLTNLASRLLVGALVLALASIAPEAWFTMQRMLSSEQQQDAPTDVHASSHLSTLTGEQQGMDDPSELAPTLVGAVRARMTSMERPGSAVSAGIRNEAPAPALSEPPVRARKRERAERAETSSRQARSTTASRREAAAKAAPGALNVTTPGCWAVVYADGQRLGMSPGRFTLPAGQHHIELAMQGKEPRKLRSTEVRAGKTERLRVDCQ